MDIGQKARKTSGNSYPPLPEINRSLSERFFGYAIKHVDVDALSDGQLASGSPLLLIAEESKQVIKDYCENFSVENQLRKPTPWTQNLIDRIGESERKNKMLSIDIDIVFGTPHEKNEQLRLMFQKSWKSESYEY